MQILDSAITISLLGVAIWTAWAVVRTAFELRAELQPVPVRQHRAQADRATSQARRSLRRAA